ncbi:unnamed protein product [Thelazia callipaeda]|uniref:C2-C2_1 domain-containing protein n=1 Tax=Thelazia callipaeda TaxID=103827 RepID=A0A0N5CYA4_THECL|nr:unnamed protein product [Thelazia callipaeda]
MVIRPPIEKWSRPELEDRYHSLYQQHYDLKQKYNELEIKLKQTNSRIRRTDIGAKNFRTDENENIQHAQLVKENRLLTNKTYLPLKRPQLAMPQRSSQSVRPLLIRSPSANTVRRPISTTCLARGSGRKPQLISETKSSLLDKTLFVKLNREMKQKEDECSSLTLKFNDVQEQLTKLKKAYDQLLCVNQQTETELKRQLAVMKLNTELPNIKEEQNIRFVEKELEIMREENEILRDANDKLVQNSLTIEQLMVEENSNHQNRLYGQHQNHPQIHELFIKYSKLEEKYQQLMKREMKAGKIASDDGELQLKSQIARGEEQESSKTDFSLVKVYEDLSRIIERHILTPSSEESKTVDNNQLDKWQRMYMEIHSELEKVRNMLLMQHTINEQHLQEIALTNQNLQQTKDNYEHKLKKLVMKLSEREAEIRNLESQLKTLAYGDQLPILQVGENKQEAETSEMMFHLSRIILSSVALLQMGTARPTVFLAIEFYDFELQTTPMLTGPE